MTNRYTYLLIDADNTLLDFLKCEKEALKKCLQMRSLPDDDHTVSVYSTINQSWWEKLERKETDRASVMVGRFRDFFAYLGYEGDPVKMKEDYGAQLAKQAFLFDGVLETCRELAKDYRMYIITNGNAMSQHARIDTSPIRSFFKDVFISEEIGADKPSKIYFDHVKEAILQNDPNFREDHALIVGDSLSSDILGGVNTGMDTCWLSFGKTNTHKTACPTYTIHDINELPTLLESVN